MTGGDLLVVALLGAGIVVGAAVTRRLLGFALLLGVPLPALPDLPAPSVDLLPAVPGA